MVKCRVIIIVVMEIKYIFYLNVCYGKAKILYLGNDSELAICAFAEGSPNR